MFMDIVEKYFTGLSERQSEQFQQLEGLYREWNEKINVISRKDRKSTRLNSSHSGESRIPA